MSAAEQRFERARDVIDAMQRALLPRGVPVLPGLEIAASYLLADTETAAGGDWFDAVALPGGRVALVVGDVVGHGVQASAIMGQLRVLLWDRLSETGDMALALEAVDRLALRVRAARAATVCVVVLDFGTGELGYVTAGHPPPLIVPAAGQPRYLPPTGAGPLATNGAFHLGHDLIDPGDLVLLYTDGILERPGRELAGASVELAQVAADVAADRALASSEPTTVERVAVQTLELLTRATGHTDDITLLVAQRTAPVTGFAAVAPAVSETVAEVRTALAKWLDAAHIGAADAHAVQHAVGELVTNAVEHAYRDAGRPGPVEVTAEIVGTGDLRVLVRDEGRWREPAADPAGYRGRGLAMVGRLVDACAVEHPGGCTEVHLDHQLQRPARLLTADTLSPGPVAVPDAAAALRIEHEGPGRLRIAGPIDATTTGRGRRGHGRRRRGRYPRADRRPLRRHPPGQRRGGDAARARRPQPRRRDRAAAARARGQPGRPGPHPRGAAACLRLRTPAPCASPVPTSTWSRTS
ncbi:SpoIIE family protein phosphatase [Nocardia sp. NPDC057353]|uniref:ATP-binding SpoIIE family protein phosphatase n=1 Tax=Nocardia sp. NPDC057353 TaxID=3346104 RepID=UPI0036446A36